MRKLLTATLLLVALQSIGQITPTNNRLKYNWVHGGEFSDTLFLKYLEGGNENKVLVLTITGSIDTVPYSTFQGGGSGGVSLTQLGDTAQSIRTDLNASKLSVSDTSAMLSSYVHSIQAGSNINIDQSNPQRPIISATASGGSSGFSDTIVISGDRDTITNTSENILYISTSQTNDTLYLADNLVLDSLSCVYIENSLGGNLILIGGLTNTLNELTNNTVQIAVRQGAFIRAFGSDGFVIMGGYSEL
jgi:hypothetical protein